MRKPHAAGWTSDSPTSAQLSEFFKQVESGRITKPVLQEFLREGLVLSEAEQLAAEILGPGKVLGYKDVCCARKFDIPTNEPELKFDSGSVEDVLREAAEANAAGTANWRLGFVTGLDLRLQRKVMGWNRKKQPCFDPDYNWWLEPQQDAWANQGLEPGYRLFDFTKNFSSLRWEVQGEKISAIGNQFVRAEEQAVTEICFSNFLLNKGERLLPDWYHWGHLQTAFGLRVCVGGFDEDGFDVIYNWPDLSDGILGVVVARK